MAQTKEQKAAEKATLDAEQARLDAEQAARGAAAANDAQRESELAAARDAEQQAALKQAKHASKGTLKYATDYTVEENGHLVTHRAARGSKVSDLDLYPEVVAGLVRDNAIEYEA